MARIIVFVADLNDVITRTDTRPGLRWADGTDRNKLVDLGLRAALVDGILNGDGRIVVAEEPPHLIAFNVYLQTCEMKYFDWLTIRTDARHDAISVAGFVRPEDRGKALLASMKGFAARHFLEQGYHRMVSLVVANNQASLRTQVRVGARPLARFSRVRIGTLMLVWEGWAIRRVGFGTKPYVATI